MQPLVQRATEHRLQLLAELAGMFEGGMFFEGFSRLPYRNDGEVILTRWFNEDLVAYRAWIAPGFGGMSRKQLATFVHEGPHEIDVSHNVEALGSLGHQSQTANRGKQEETDHGSYYTRIFESIGALTAEAPGSESIGALLEEAPQCLWRKEQGPVKPRSVDGSVGARKGGESVG